jgi:hypothetical protein
VEEYDAVLTECLESVAGAVITSLSEQNKDAAAQRNLWYHAGKTAVEAGNSGLILPENFRSAVVQMLEHEIKGRCTTKDQRPSISPWDGMLLGLSPDLILKISQQYSRLLKLKPGGRLREYVGGEFVVAFISADLVDHSTAHIVTADLIAMSKLQQQGLILWVVCVAKRERIASMNKACPYRTALKDSLGERFLEVGHLSLAKMKTELGRVHPHAIMHAGFHECDDQPQVLNGSLESIVLQTVAHAGPTGSNRVDFILASQTAIPKENEAHFSEKVLRIDAPFLGNSFRPFFDGHAEKLHQVRTDPGVRSQVREALGLPTERKLLTNISLPNRLRPDYFEMIFALLRRNPDTDMVLVDHVESFNIRIKARFKAVGLENRLWLVPYQDLHDGSLHRFIGAVELYVNNGGYSGHTALNDALWAARVVISLQSDKSLAGMIAADLHTAFGTPENLCRTAADATERINQLLQNSEAYAEACSKSERCRRESRMYDSALRAQLVYAALKEAYASKAEEQKRHEYVGAANSWLADTDIPEVSERLGAIGVHVQGAWQHSEYSIEMPAEFRGVQVTVVLPAQLACDDVVGSPVLIEIEARDFMSKENGHHAWTRALPLNERDVHKEGDCQLDAISLTVKGHTLHALLLERPLSTAASFFDDLAHEWQTCAGLPLDSLLDRTIIAQRALLQLLACVHGRKRSFGGDPLSHLHLSHLKDGHLKTAVAKIVRSDGTPCAIMLGRATHMQTSTRLHRPGCSHAKAQAVVSVRDRRSEDHRSSHSNIARVSARNVSKTASFSSNEIQSLLKAQPRPPTPLDLVDGKLPCCGGYACVELAQRDDLRRAAQVIMNAILGKSKGPTVVEPPERIGEPGKGWGERCSGAELYMMFLDGLDGNAFQNSTGLFRMHGTDPAHLFKRMQRKTLKFAQLLDLLAKMLGSAPLQARKFLEQEELFKSIVEPSNRLPEGLESAPANRREGLQACAPLMQALSAKTQHYYVEGKTEIMWGRGSSAVSKRLISVWLVYTLNPEKGNLPYRSVRAAEPGTNGDLVALYDERLNRDPTMTKFLDVCYTLRIPNVGECPHMDGKGRALMDAPRRVQESKVGMYLNSTKNSAGKVVKTVNCSRLWDPEWKGFGSGSGPCSVPDDARMGLVLIRDVKEYDELEYSYDWSKHESTCGKADIYQSMSKSGGNR